MKAFRFALQPLLDARMREEDEHRNALAAAAGAAGRERARAVQTREAFARAGRAFSRSARSLQPEAVREAWMHLELLAVAVRYAEALSRRCADRELLARDAFAAARLERRRVELLRDRACAAFEQEAERRETLAAEETNAAKHDAAAAAVSLWAIPIFAPDSESARAAH